MTSGQVIQCLKRGYVQNKTVAKCCKNILVFIIHVATFKNVLKMFYAKTFAKNLRLTAAVP